MPTAKYDRNLGTQLLDRSRDSNGRPDVRSGEHRNTQAKSVCGLTQDRRLVIRGNQIVHEFYIKSRLQQGRGETKKGEGRAQWWPVIGRIEQHDFVGS